MDVSGGCRYLIHSIKLGNVVMMIDRWIISFFQFSSPVFAFTWCSSFSFSHFLMPLTNLKDYLISLSTVIHLSIHHSSCFITSFPPPPMFSTPAISSLALCLISFYVFLFLFISHFSTLHIVLLPRVFLLCSLEVSLFLPSLLDITLCSSAQFYFY